MNNTEPTIEPRSLITSFAAGSATTGVLVAAVTWLSPAPMSAKWAITAFTGGFVVGIPLWLIICAWLIRQETTAPPSFQQGGGGRGGREGAFDKTVSEVIHNLVEILTEFGDLPLRVSLKIPAADQMPDRFVAIDRATVYERHAEQIGKTSFSMN